jgi:predicted ATP-dependent endonuclease of OLD family
LQNDRTTYGVDYDFIFDKLSVKDYYFVKTQETIKPAQNTIPAQPAKTVEKIIIKAKTNISEEEMESYAQLDNEQFKKLIKDALVSFAEQITIPVDVWKASPEYLIQDKIQLKDFAKNLVNLPLKNMFYLAGQKNKEEISQKIAEIEKDNKQRRKLAGMLSKKTTEYLNKKWKEHEIEIEVEIGNDLVASVFVKDKCDKDNYFNMSDRSQGFKQFVSLLLSISVSNTSGDIKDHLILIDEPEVHPHPSGIRWMLEELLEIGKNNYLFISTHSDFMLDKDTKDRHFLLTKGKDNLTKGRQIKTEEDVNDDEILKSAFGINVIADFLSPYKILVEGSTDKALLLKALDQLHKNHGILITNGTGSNVPAIASIMAFQDINPVVITDDDKTGREMKEAVIKIGDNFKEVFTIRDLNGNITDNGTIEDTLPKDFVESTMNKVLKQNKIEEISLTEILPFCEQLSLHLNQKIAEESTTKKDKKQKVDDILVKVKTKIAEYDEKSITEEKAPKLYQLADAILVKLGIKK